MSEGERKGGTKKGREEGRRERGDRGMEGEGGRKGGGREGGRERESMHMEYPFPQQTTYTITHYSAANIKNPMLAHMSINFTSFPSCSLR